MNRYPRRRCHLFYTAVLLSLVLLMSGCSGITPDNGNLRNNREEGPEKGLFTGSAGEFVIMAPANVTKPEDVAGEEEALKE